MAILPLVIAPDERLNQPSATVEVVDDSVRTLIADMLETMYHNKGIGLAAVQVGVQKRVIVVDIEWGSPRYEGTEHENKPGKPMTFINPEIIEESEDLFKFKEGCLSFPEHYSDVERPAEVTVRYLDGQGNEQTARVRGLLSVCLQHEIDHTNGVVFVDHISKLKRDMILRKLKKAKRLGLTTEDAE